MPTNRGHFSYANVLEKRVITNNWTSYYSRTLGQMTFKRMTAPSLSGNDWDRPVIGYEMVHYRTHRWRNPQDFDWIFRCYHDGTALYKRNKVRQYIRGWRACQAIDDVVDEHFYLDAELNSNDDYYERVQVLRRKPLSSYARLAAQRENDLGDFLIRKYNLGGKRDAVSC